MILLMRNVVYDSPSCTLAGGCSLTDFVGTIHETDGIAFASTAATKLSTVWMLLSWPAALTVSNCGSGFQIDGVFAFCGTGTHSIASGSVQSGSSPVKT